MGGGSALSHRQGALLQSEPAEAAGNYSASKETEKTEDWCKEFHLTWGERDEVLARTVSERAFCSCIRTNTAVVEDKHKTQTHHINLLQLRKG